MGLLGSKKKVYVASVAYNMAGDELERPNYLKSLLVGNIVSHRKTYLGEIIPEAYKRGPGMKLRQFYNWSLNNYGEIGLPTSQLDNQVELDPDLLADQLPAGAGEIPIIAYAEKSEADFYFWAEQWLLLNHPDKVDLEWSCDMDEVTGEITITLPDTSTYEFTPVGYDPAAEYIYVNYSLASGLVPGAVTAGAWTLGSTLASLPSTAGWRQIENSSNPQRVSLNTQTVTEITYSGDNPPSTNTNTVNRIETFKQFTATYQSKDYLGLDTGTGEIREDVTTMYQRATYTVVPVVTVETETSTMMSGVTKTVTKTITTDTIVGSYDYRYDTQQNLLSHVGPPRWFIYKYGTGNAVLDGLVDTEEGDGEYFPTIPVRLDNEFLSSTNNPDAYELASRAYKKATGSKFDLLVDKIADNPSLGDIDHAFVVFGVSLNVRENACREYLYRYFHNLMAVQTTDPAEYGLWEAKQNAFGDKAQNWIDWQTAQTDPDDPLYGTPEPDIMSFIGSAKSQVNIQSEGEFNIKYRTSIEWNNIVELTGTGKLKPDAQVGELWFSSISSADKGNSLFGLKNLIMDSCRLNWQVTANSWKSLLIIGMVHKNFVYKNKAVVIGTSEALEDTDESGFIVPLHYPTLREMSLVKSTQMSTACCFLVLNCYKIVKIKWYQRGLFKIIIVIVVVIVVTLATNGAGTPGILGTNIAVGTAVGLTGIAAVIAGAIINALASLILTHIIMAGATAIFGDKLGALLGTIISFVALNVGTAFANGTSLAASWSNMMSAQGLMSLTSSVGNGVSQYILASTQGLIQKTENMLERYEQQSKSITEAYAQNIGYDTGLFDPLKLVDVSNPFDQIMAMETRDSYLSRTLMTGHDIADMTLTMLNDFADLTLNPAIKL